MNEDTLNMETRKFLKKVGVTSQRELEHAILKAVEEGSLRGSETIDVKMTIESDTIGVNYCIQGKIALE